MAKRLPKSGISHNSHSPADKLLACLNHGVGVASAAYMQSPGYFDACARWWSDLAPDKRETVLVVIDAYTHARRDAAEKIADSLPSAPKCPL